MIYAINFVGDKKFKVSMKPLTQRCLKLFFQRGNQRPMKNSSVTVVKYLCPSKAHEKLLNIQMSPRFNIYRKGQLGTVVKYL